MLNGLDTGSIASQLLIPRSIYSASPIQFWLLNLSKYKHLIFFLKLGRVIQK